MSSIFLITLSATVTWREVPRRQAFVTREVSVSQPQSRGMILGTGLRQLSRVPTATTFSAYELTVTDRRH